MASVQLKLVVTKQWRPRYDSRYGAARPGPACCALRATRCARCVPPLLLAAAGLRHGRNDARRPSARSRRGISPEERTYLRQHILDLISQDDSKVGREEGRGMPG